MFNATNHQINKNATMRTPSHSCRNCYHQKVNTQQVLAIMWRKENPHWLVGLQICAATVKKWKVPQKMLSYVTILSLVMIM